MVTFKEYKYALQHKNISQVILVQLMDDTETNIVPIWTDLYENSGSINVHLQNGVRRSFTITLHNAERKYDVDVNKIWIYQKIKIYTGIQFMRDNGEVDNFLVPQGVYYITNPQSAYNPELKTITLECVDKFARLDGRLGGKLDGSYSFPKNYTDSIGNEYQYEYNMFDIIKNLLKTPLRIDIRNIAFMPTLAATTNEDKRVEINKFLDDNSFDLFRIKKSEAITINNSGEIYYCSNDPNPTTPIYPEWTKFIYDNSRVIDRLEPLLNEYFLTGDVLGIERVMMPYSISKDIGESYGDIILEIAKILGASAYYDRAGRFILEPTQEDSGFLLDSQKEVVWDFYEEDGILYNISETNDFEGLGNQIIAKGTISGVGSYTVAIQNNDILSPTNVDRIGVKTFTYDNLGVYSYKDFVDKKDMSENEAIEFCKDLLREYAMHLLKKQTIVQTKISIRCLPIHHLDVDKVITITKDNNTRKKYLITSLTLPLSSTEPMIIEANEVFDIKEVKKLL